MNAGEKIPRVSRIAPFVERLRDFSTGVSLVGFYLAGIGAFIFAVAYLKGVQVLMFIPALFLSMLLHSFYETWSIGRRTKFTLEKSKDGYLIDVRSDLRSNLSFRIGFKDATGKVVFADPDSKTLSILRPGSGESEIFAYWHGSFDLFRRVARIGKIPRSSVAWDWCADNEPDAYSAVKRYESGDYVGKIESVRSSASDVPYVRLMEAVPSALPFQGAASGESIPIRCNVPLVVPNSLEKSRSIGWQLIALCSAIIAVQWQEPVFLALIVATAALFWVLKYVIKIAKVSKFQKTAFIFVCFVVMLLQARASSDLTGPSSVFLMQILIVHSFYPENRDESFLSLFLSLFVFATVSFLSFQVWYVAFFLVLLLLVVRQLFEASGYFGKESVFLPIRSKPSKRLLAGVLLPLYAGTFALFFVIPHGDGTRSPISPIDRSASVDDTVSWFGNEIVLDNVLKIKKDVTKKIIVKDVSDSDAVRLKTAYWKGERFLDFDGNRWRRNSDVFGLSVVKSVSQDVEPLKISYFEPGSRNLFFPSVPTGVSTAAASRGISATVRLLDNSIYRTSSAMGPNFEVLASFVFSPGAKTETPAFVFSGSFAPLPKETEALFANYWASIDLETAKDPTRLAKHVRDASGFSYSIDAPAKNLRSFLYEDKRGHCEYFATTLALTLRHFGHPASVVNGYYSGDLATFSDSWIIRWENAHSWVEVLDSDRGWIILDPTPSDFLVGRTAFETMKFAAVSAYDYADLGWYTYVVGFGRTAQRDMVSGISAYFYPALNWLLAILAAVGSAFMARRVLRYRRLTEKERFLSYLRRKANSPFPLSVFAEGHFELVKETRAMIFWKNSASTSDIENLKKRWESRLRTRK